MKKVSLIAIDLDGTLLTGARVLAPEGAGLLKEVAQKGVHVILSTTRNPDTVQPFCRELEIDAPLICTNGAQIWGSPDGPVWAYYTIPQAVALAIALWADGYDWELSTTIGSMTYWHGRPGQTLGPISPNITIMGTNSAAISGDPVRILVSQPEAIASIRSLCQTKFAGQCRTETYYKPDGRVHSLCIFAPHADKGTALALICDRLGVERETVMAIGDNLNDLAMFRYARLSVAMANAPGAVKQKATVVAPSNDDEGVAWAVKTFVL